MADDQANDQGGNDEDPTPGMQASSDAQGGGDTGGAGDGSNTARDTDGRGSANDERVADPNVEAVTAAFEGRGAADRESSNDDVPASGISRDGPDTVDLEDFSGASRREPGR